MRSSATALVLLCIIALAAPAHGGGGPEGVVIVVNGDSPLSLWLANEYARLRNLPPGRICVLADVPVGPVVSVEAFRNRIWKPVRGFLEERGLIDRVDVIAYSADFPYAVDFAADKAPPYGQGISANASLTGMTYLARRVERKDADGYLDLQVNKYARRYSGGEAGARPARRPTQQEAAHYQTAMAALQAKDYAKAIESYRALLASYPEHMESWYNLACCLSLTGKADDALAALTQAVDRGWSDAGHTAQDTDLEPLRTRPEFAALMDRMKKSAAAQTAAEYTVQPAQAFSARSVWTGGDAPATDGAADSLDRYWLSVMLAYTFERGNSLPEALAYLRAAAGSDGTNPAGTVYFLRNDDVRSKTREPLFATAMSALKRMGRATALYSKDDPVGQTGVLPVGRDDVIGAVVGIAGFDWPGSKSRLLPGSIAEHLTSFGAMFAGGGQTKISEFLRAGAAGSSGAVAEPYALQQKFPTPHLHVFYAEGCSLAESFYQSVSGPYQLLVVGDPLARPFARLATVSLLAPDAAAPAVGTVEVRAAVAPAKDREIARIELWIDGRWVADAAPGAAIPWDTTLVPDGGHEVRMVAVESGRIGTRSFAATRVIVKNGKAGLTVQPIKGPVKYGDSIALSGVAPGGKEVVVLAGGREIARAPVKGGAWKCTAPTTATGPGPVTLQVRSEGPKGEILLSPHVDVIVESPAQRAASKAANTQGGLLVTLTDSAGKPQEFSLNSLDGPAVAKAFEGKNADTAREIRIEGEFEVPAAGIYQLCLFTRAGVKMSVDGAVALERGPGSADRIAGGLAALDAGWHALKLELKPSGAPDLEVQLGGAAPAEPLKGKALRHAKKGKPGK